MFEIREKSKFNSVRCFGSVPVVPSTGLWEHALGPLQLLLEVGSLNDHRRIRLLVVRSPFTALLQLGHQNLEPLLLLHVALSDGYGKWWIFHRFRSFLRKLARVRHHAERVLAILGVVNEAGADTDAHTILTPAA